MQTAVGNLPRLAELQARYRFFLTKLDTAVIRQRLQDCKSQSQTTLLLGYKDNIATKEFDTTCGSRALDGYRSPFDATVCRLLAKLQGRFLAIGKTTMDEFAMGSGGLAGTNRTCNPLFHDRDVIPGGSSGGSASAVRAHVVDVALGTDTGGSIRLPACYTSTLGFKPSYGRISRFGVVPFAQSLDTVGIIANRLDIIREVYHALNQFDPKDPTSLGTQYRKQLVNVIHSKKSKIGIPIDLFVDLQPRVRKEVYNSLKDLQRRGHELVIITLPTLKYSLPIYYTIAPAEAASNLARYDGIRYGHTNCNEHNIATWDELYALNRVLLGDEVQSRIILGNSNLCSEAYGNNYLKAAKLRVRLINEFDSVFKYPNILTGSLGNKEKGVDLIITPTATNEPISVEEYQSLNEKSPTHSYLNDICTIPMSLAGLPTISIPTSKDTPIGLQITSQYGHDSHVLDFVEQNFEYTNNGLG